MRVLFIGNSFTARHDVPLLVAKFAAATGVRLEHRLIAAGGASLRRHWNAGEAARAIARGAWDAVVLQEQSTLPVRDPARMRANVACFAPLVATAGARLVLYATWARADAPGDQRAIDAAYAQAAADSGATIAPVGAAWARLRRRRTPVLHDADGSHATLAGAYLAAAVIAGALIAPAPVAPVEVAGVTPRDATPLIDAASSARRGPAPAARRRRSPRRPAR